LGRSKLQNECGEHADLFGVCIQLQPCQKHLQAHLRCLIVPAIRPEIETRELFDIDILKLMIILGSNDSQHSAVQCLGDWNKDQIVRMHQIPVKIQMWFELGGCIYLNHM
jgi:hypothetical protein